MQLTDQEKEEINKLLEAGEPLPDKYRFALFREPHEAELIWPGKTNEITNVVLPFQSIEQIDEPRAETAATGADLFTLDRTTGRQSGGWTNKLIWGDNKLVLSSLKNGPLRREIENAGGLKLVYIDPPFDVGADFSYEAEIGGGEETVVKEASVIEDVAYRDTWGRGVDSFISMIFERLRLISDLLHSDGSLFVHCDYRVNAYIRMALDEIFGRDNIKNEIIWKYSGGRLSPRYFGRKHDDIYWFAKSDTWTFNRDEVRDEYAPATKERFANVVRNIREGKDFGEQLLNPEGKHPEDVFNISIEAPSSNNRTGYPTQKPEPLLERILLATSNAGDLVADFFCGSGTTLAVAEKLGRKWIGCDLGRFAIHTSRKRLIGVQRELKGEGKPYRSFEILNLGKYERQYFVGIDHTLPDQERAALSAQKEEHYVSLILFAYRAERVFQSPPFHGRKGATFILIGPLDAPVTRFQIEEAVDACRKLKTSRLDVLGFEFEMGLNPQCVDEAKTKGVSLILRYIPKEVFDKRAVDKNQVVFYDVAYVELHPMVKGRKVVVKLKDFGVSYRQDDVDSLAGEMKPGTKVIVADGQVVKITKDKKGIVKREILTKKWQDWIDYWAVDFDFTRRPETIVVTLPDATGRMVNRRSAPAGSSSRTSGRAFVPAATASSISRKRVSRVSNKR